MEKEIVKFYIFDTFLITTRGLVFVGYIIDGVIKMSSYVEFTSKVLDQLSQIKLIQVLSFNVKMMLR